MNSTMDATDQSILGGGGDETHAPLWVWIGLSAIAGASFWCQATVTEER